MLADFGPRSFDHGCVCGVLYRPCEQAHDRHTAAHASPHQVEKQMKSLFLRQIAQQADRDPVGNAGRHFWGARDMNHVRRNQPLPLARIVVAKSAQHQLAKENVGRTPAGDRNEHRHR